MADETDGREFKMTGIEPACSEAEPSRLGEYEMLRAREPDSYELRNQFAEGGVNYLPHLKDEE